MDLPKWTVLYNIAGGKYVGTGWEFFDSYDEAKARYEELDAQGHVPALRPFYVSYDINHMGAVHRNCYKSEQVEKTA